jgi:hypothetical protein
MWVGIFLVLLGVLFFLDNMEILHGEVWSYAWPLALLLLGVSMIMGRIGKGGGRRKDYEGNDFTRHNQNS